MLRTVLVACVLAFTCVAPVFADPTGLWREKDGGTIRIRPCGRAYCAAIASVQPRHDPETGKPRTDKHNPHAGKRHRPLIGVAVLSAMRPNGPGKWSGTLYDSDSGKTHTGNLVELGPNSIRIEGCAMGLCGGEELSRVSR